MNLFRVIIVDDEQPARENLKSLLLLLYPDAIIVAEAANAQQALAVLSKYEADIIFLDINIGEQTSFDVLDQLQHLNIQPVFVTAYDNHALEAFRYAAQAYLLKPVTISDLQQTVDRILANKQIGISGQFTGMARTETTVTDDRLFISDRNGWQVIQVNHISYLEADGSYSKIFMDDDKLITSSRNMKYYEQQIEKSGLFIKVHKSFIVNRKSIQAYNSTTNLLTLQNGKQVPVALSAKDMRVLMG